MASSGKLCCSASEMTIPLSVAAACSSKLNERQNRLRSASPHARLIRAPNGAWNHQLHSAAPHQKNAPRQPCASTGANQARPLPP